MKTVLVVDDNLLVRRQLSRLLERDGCAVYEAADGEQALAVLCQKRIEIVFLDLHMPKLDGEGFLQAMKRLDLKVPVVLITSSESSTEIVRAFKLGAKDYLLKPFREAQIHRALQLACGLDYATVHRTTADLVVLDADDGFAQVVRGLVGDTDRVEHVESMEHVAGAVSRRPQAVLVGSLSVPATPGPEEAEAIGETVVRHHPDAVLIRMIPSGETLPDVTVFHAAVTRGDEAGLKQALLAVRAGTCLTLGRLIRALKYDGPPELSALYWCALRVSIDRACKALSHSAAPVTIDLSLTPEEPERLDTLSLWLGHLAPSLGVEFIIKRDPPRPVLFAGAQSAPGPSPEAGPASPSWSPPTAVVSPGSNVRPPMAASSTPLPSAPSTSAEPLLAPRQATPLPASSVSQVSSVSPVSAAPSGRPGPSAPGQAEQIVASGPKVESSVSLPGYDVVGLIGEGGMSRVFRATQRSLRRSVCIKVMREEIAQDPQLVERFHDEGVALAAMRHPNIVSVLDVGRADDGRFFIVMEYVHGGDLRRLIERSPRVPLREVLGLMNQLLAGLGEAHANGIVHRDLKPSNVLVSELKDKSTLLKLVDFGIAKLMEGVKRTGGNTRFGTVVGTPGYMAPEQLLGMEITAATDLYAAGIILFELVTGRRPFIARDEFELAQMTMMQPVPQLSAYAEGPFPPALEELVSNLLKKNPRDRPQSAGAVREALQSIVP